ncbi:ATP-binding protein [Kamptonema cortianum]|nr:ATP-binding protein [Kamptonema cortianum]
MDYSRLVRLNQGLLTGTALLGLGSIVAGAVGGPIWGGIANFTAGMVANYLGALVDRLRTSSDVLRNEDIAKAAGRAVGKTLLETISPRYPKIQKSLEALAEKTEGYWVEWAEQAKTLNLFESLREDQLYQIFAQKPETFTDYQVLPEEQWQEVVIWLFEQGCENGVLLDSLESYQDVISDLAQELEKNFTKNLRQVLKDDAASGGKAFSGMLFDLHGATLAKIDAIQEYLPKIASKEDVCRLLQQLDTAIRDELSQIRETLQQYFDLNRPRLPIPQECETVIAEKTLDFVGREYVFTAIRDFLQRQPKGYFILEADPGVGKSAILAKLVQLLKRRCLTHFNIQAQGIIKPQQFLENICTQLIQGYNLDYPRLPEKTAEDGNVLARLLGEASKTLEPGQKLVVVVDALDEVDSSSQTQGSNILYLPDALPDRVYFILSKRPKQLPLPLSDYQTTFDLMQYPAESARDARRYAENRWRQSPQIQEWVKRRNSAPEQFFTELVAKSENNFMYLRYVLNDIHDGLYGSETLDSLPEGLQRYYQKHWRLMGMNANPLPIDKIRTIYVLCLVREAVSRFLLAQLTEIAEYQLGPILKEWEQFLRLQKVEGKIRYTLYHASFSDFLKEQAEDSGVDLENIKRCIAENFAKGAPL